MYPNIEEIIKYIVDEGVKIVFTSAGNPKTWTAYLKENGITVVHVVSSSFALKAQDAGVDAIVAEGLKLEAIMKREETYPCFNSDSERKNYNSLNSRRRYCWTRNAGHDDFRSRWSSGRE
jgi:hypothetical protein